MGEAFCHICGGKADFICQVVLCPATQRDVVRCASCGAAFYNPAPSASEISRCYQASYYGGVLKRYWKDYYKGLRMGSRLKRIKPHGSYLDIGCAFGTMLAGVRDSSGWHVQGTEFSEDTAHIGTEINGVEILAAPSLQSAGFKAESFDYIFANNVLEHLPEPYSFLKDVRGLLKPGGYLHLILPNGVNDISPNEIVWKRKRTALGARHDGHIWFFSEHSLRILFEKSGFITEKFLGFHFTDALKSRGLWPGAIGRFEKKHFKPAEDANRSRPAAAKPSIPPKRSRIIDDASALLRGIFKLSYFRGGGDFDILLRRKQ